MEKQYRVLVQGWLTGLDRHSEEPSFEKRFTVFARSPERAQRIASRKMAEFMGGPTSYQSMVAHVPEEVEK